MRFKLAIVASRKNSINSIWFFPYFVQIVIVNTKLLKFDPLIGRIENGEHGLAVLAVVGRLIPSAGIGRNLQANAISAAAIRIVSLGTNWR